MLEMDECMSLIQFLMRALASPFSLISSFLKMLVSLAALPMHLNPSLRLLNTAVVLPGELEMLILLLILPPIGGRIQFSWHLTAKSRSSLLLGSME